jgi:energy-converting hydrogenase Eha subunit E
MLDWLHIPLPELFAVVAAVAFASGLNVYATVAALGLLARLGHVPLPPALQLLESSPIIAASAALFVIEFFADKIPAFDLLWSALHTFVRVPVAALLAYGATRQLSPGQQLLAALLGAAIALAAHGGKTALRAAVTPSPEPISNIALSLGEDALAVSLTWLATRHPYAAATIVVVLLAVITVLVRAVVKALRSLFRGAERELAGRST